MMEVPVQIHNRPSSSTPTIPVRVGGLNSDQRAPAAPEVGSRSTYKRDVLSERTAAQQRPIKSSFRLTNSLRALLPSRSRSATTLLDLQSQGSPKTKAKTNHNSDDNESDNSKENKSEQTKRRHSTHSHRHHHSRSGQVRSGSNGSKKRSKTKPSPDEITWILPSKSIPTNPHPLTQKSGNVNVDGFGDRMGDAVRADEFREPAAVTARKQKLRSNLVLSPCNGRQKIIDENVQGLTGDNRGQGRPTQRAEKLSVQFCDEVQFDKSSNTLHQKKTIDDLKMTLKRYKAKMKRDEDKNSKNILKLDKENEELQLKLCELQERADYWKNKAKKQSNDNVILARLKLLAREKLNFQEDVDVLKSVIRRLNKELSFYQEKLQNKYIDQPENIPLFSPNEELEDPKVKVSKGHGHRNEDSEFRGNLVMLGPLLQAYDEVIAEKNELIKEHESTLLNFRLKCQEVIQENNYLHHMVGKGREKETVSLEDWQLVHDNALLVLEENDLLHNQVKILKKKITAVQAASEDKVKKLREKLNELNGDNLSLKSALVEVDKHSTLLTDQINKMAIIIQQRIPVEDHENSVKECKQLFEDLKQKYAGERGELNSKLVALQTEKERLVSEITDLDSENSKLLAKIQALEESLLTSCGQLQLVHNKLTEAAQTRAMTTEAVNELMALARSVLEDRDIIKASLNEQIILNENMKTIKTKEARLVEELTKKISLIENAYQEDLRKSSQRVEEVDAVLETVAERHRAEVSHLNELLKERATHIEKLTTEKKQLAEDLETVWKATIMDRGPANKLPLPAPRSLTTGPTKSNSRDKE